jgi:hypothetical protein
LPLANPEKVPKQYHNYFLEYPFKFIMTQQFDTPQPEILAASFNKQINMQQGLKGDDEQRSYSFPLFFFLSYLLSFLLFEFRFLFRFYSYFFFILMFLTLSSSILIYCFRSKGRDVVWKLSQNSLKLHQVKCLKERNHWGDQDIGGWTILKWFLER